MKKLKTGDFTITLNLDKDKEYQFRYLIDSSHWINDPEADKQVPNVFQSENSVIVV
jgi:nitrogen fixation protein FixH